MVIYNRKGSADSSALLNLPFDIWADAGLVKSKDHPAGRFYYTDDEGAPDLNYFVPDFAAVVENLPTGLEQDIISFYEQRGREPALTVLRDSAEAITANFNRQVYHRHDFVFMAGDLAASIRTLEAKLPETTLRFREIDDMNDPDYLDVFQSVFLSGSETHYDKTTYKSFLNTYRNAANRPSFSPSAVVGYTLDGDKPVSIVTILPKGEFAGFYSGGVYPGYRESGYAGQTMQQAFVKARRAGAQTGFITTLPGSAVEMAMQTYGFSNMARFSNCALK